jgi:hypothetical protein
MVLPTLNDALRQRAELYLLQLVDHERSRRGRSEDPPWRRGTFSYQTPVEARHKARRDFIYAVEALIAVGALPEEEAPSWRERFDSAEPREPSLPSPDTAPDPETEHQVRKLLDERLPPSDLDKESQAHRDAVWRFEEALTAIRISGALSAAEQRERSGQLDERLSADEKKRRHQAWMCDGVELLRVLPGSSTSHDGLTITHLELYADGFVLHAHRAMSYRKPEARELTPEEHRDAFREALPEPWVAARFEVDDDIETSYHCLPGPSHGIADSKDVLVYWVSAIFTPAVPEEATRLFIRHEEATFEIPLRS